jgi:SnoaL-like domain
MNDTEPLQAIEQIKQTKSRYFRGVDTSDGALVRSILADDCVLDYMGCCTDPKTGRDFLPTMNIVMRGSAAWSDGGMAAFGIVSVHHGHNGEVTLTSDTTASAIWPMTDRLYLPAGAPFSLLLGFGYYHETYEKIGGVWKIKTLRIQRIRVEAS